MTDVHVVVAEEVASTGMWRCVDLGLSAGTYDELEAQIEAHHHVRRSVAEGHRVEIRVERVEDE